MTKEKKKEGKEAGQSALQVWKNNWFLLKLCFAASPVYMITYLLMQSGDSFLFSSSIPTELVMYWKPQNLVIPSGIWRSF